MAPACGANCAVTWKRLCIPATVDTAIPRSTFDLYQGMFSGVSIGQSSLPASGCNGLGGSADFGGLAESMFGTRKPKRASTRSTFVLT